MKILFDHNLPHQLRKALPGHLVRFALEEGWNEFPDDQLLRAAERAGFQVMITADQNIFHQQHNQDRTIALVVLTANRGPSVLQQTEQIRTAVETSSPGSYTVVHIPLPAKRPKRQNV